MEPQEKESKKGVQQQIQQLRKQIEHHNFRYFALADPEISDTQFDALFKELQTLEEQHPELVTPDSPTQKVGGMVVSGFETVDHAQPMLSLGNTYNEQDIRDFDGRVRRILKGAPFSYSCELKIDGVSFALRYYEGKLQRAISRGNGVTGEDITAHVRRIPSLPLSLPQPLSLEVRGEVYMPRAMFARINNQRDEEGLEPFANPRNATAGTLRQLDTGYVRKRGLDFFVYHLLHPEQVMHQEVPQTQAEVLQALRNWGLRVEPHWQEVGDIAGVIDFWKRWIGGRHELDFEIDGVVVKVNQLALHPLLGYTSHSPRWAIAFKFPAEQKESTLEKIELSVGRTGTITPVAHVQPVRLAGTTVRKATLHNFEYLRQKDIRVGDRVLVEKAGDIIPQIVASLPEKRSGSEQSIQVPEKCPICKGPTGKTNPDEVAIRCLNPLCPARVKRSVGIFASRVGMDIEGLGEKLIELLVEEGMIHTVADLYYLEEEKLIALPRMAQKSAHNLMVQIEQSKKKPLHRLLVALGIPQVGSKTAKDLALHFRSLEALQEASAEQLTAIEGIGDEVAASIRTFFQTASVKDTLEKLRNAGVNFEEHGGKKLAASTPLQGLTFVLTGTLPSFSRDQMREKIEELGGKVTTSVSKKTDYLLAGQDAGSKLQKAKELGVPVLDQEGFFSLLEERKGHP